jgi:hypothetical protein
MCERGITQSCTGRLVRYYFVRTLVINNCMGETDKENLDLKSQKFSILIDESTDIAVVKTVAVVVRNLIQSMIN